MLSIKVPVGFAWQHCALGQDPSGRAVHDLATKELYGLQRSTLTLTRQYEWSEKPTPINWLVMSSLRTSMIVPTIFFKFLSWQTDTWPFLSYCYHKVVAESQLFWKNKTLNASDDKAPVHKFELCRVPIPNHYSQVHSDLEWLYLLVSHVWVKDLGQLFTQDYYGYLLCEAIQQKTNCSY